LTISALFLCYNCQDYVAAALRSVLGQDVAEPMEIIVSDDASTDATLAVVEQELRHYRGPHQVRTLRRDVNSGSKSGHLNQVFPLADGDILVSFDADDLSEPHRVRRIAEAFGKDRSVQAVYSGFAVIDPDGHLRGRGRVPHPPPGTSPQHWFAQVDAYAAGATLAVRRDVVGSFPPLDPAIHEDLVLPFRASLLGDVVYIDEALVQARRHPASLTADFGQFASLENYRARMFQGIHRAQDCLRSRLDDIGVARRLLPDNWQEWDALEHIAQGSLARAEMTRPLFSPRILTRWMALARLIRAGAYMDELPQNMALALAPATYLRYKRMQLSIRPGHTER